MLGLMEKKKPAKKIKAKQGPMFAMRIDKETEAALARFMDAQRVRPDKTAVGLLALREFLEREGFWPPETKE